MGFVVFVCVAFGLLGVLGGCGLTGSFNLGILGGGVLLLVVAWLIFLFSRRAVEPTNPFKNR